MLTSQGNINHCHDCERNIRCKYRISELFLCDTCDKKRRKPTPHLNSSPIQVIQSIAKTISHGLVKSISRAARQVVQKASSSNGLRKSHSAGSIKDLLPASQVPSTSVGEHETTATTPTTLTQSQLSPSQSLSPTSNIFSPTQQNHSDEEIDIQNISLPTDGQTAQVKSNQSRGSSKSKSKVRRSRRLRGVEVEERIRPKKSTRQQKDTKGKNKSTKVSKQKKKSASQPVTHSPPSDPVRCSLCMEWFHAPEEELFGGAVWTCKTCRTIPSVIINLQKRAYSCSPNQQRSSIQPCSTNCR